MTAPDPSDLARAATPARSITARVVTGATWMMAWRMISRALGFVSVLILAGLLAPADFGIVAIASAVSSSIDGLSSLGVRDALVRLDHERRDYYDTAFTFQVIRGVLTGVLIAGAGLVAPDALGDPRMQTILLVFGASTIIGSFENIGVVRFSRTLDFRTQFVMQAAPRLVGFLITTTLAILLRSYWALVIGSAVGKVVQVAASYVLSPHRPGFGMAGWRYLLQFSFWTWAGGIVLTILQQADPFIIGPVIGTAAFGLYVLATEIAFLPVSELLGPACAALFPGFALARRQGSEPVAMGLSVAGALALGTIPFSIGISACSGYLVNSLLGPQWQDAQPLIAVLAWICMFSPFSWVTVTVLSAQGQVRRVFFIWSLAVLIKVPAILAVRRTLDLALIAETAVLVVTLETIIFIWQLRAAGNAELRILAGTMGRAALSAIVTSGVLAIIPGTWQHVTLGRVGATLAGGLIGGLSFAVFFVCQAALWHLAGRPAGSEQRLLSITRENPRIANALRRMRLA